MNRQTFYYHFDDVYDLLEWVFEEDANRVLPSEVVYEHWRDDVMMFFKYLADNSVFALNIYNSNSSIYMLRYFKRRLQGCIRSFAIIVSEGKNIDRTDFEFVVEFYANGIVGLISQWLVLILSISSRPKPPVTTEVLVLRRQMIQNARNEEFLLEFSARMIYTLSIVPVCWNW